MMIVSTLLGGAGSVANSAVPVFENTTETWGNLRIVLSTRKLQAWDWESDVLGIRKTFMAMFYSSSVGTKTWPSLVNSGPAIRNKTTARR